MKEYYYEFERMNAYCYPDSCVLVNKLGIKDAEILQAVERELTSTRMQQLLEFPVLGKFNLKHLKAIHRFLLADIYLWAGELRTVNIAKGNQFCLYQHIESFASIIFTELKSEKYLLNTPKEKVPERLAYYFGEINVLHPFREGNGRAQRVFIEYLAQSIGYSISFEDVSADEMIEASALAFAKDYKLMQKMFEHIATPISPEEQREFRTKLGLTQPKKKQQE